MGKQIEFKLKEINTKESMKDGIDDETKSFKYSNEIHGVELKVKGEENADNLGLPTMTLDDSILIEFGPKQIQAKLQDDLQAIGKPSGKTFPEHKKHDEPATKTKKTPGRKKK